MRLLHGDCREAMRELPENSIDAIVSDPPYGLEFMGASWDRLGDVGKTSHSGIDPEPGFKGFRLPSYNGSSNAKCAACGKWRWDYPERKCVCASPEFANVKAHQAAIMQSWHESWAREAYRVLKPGGHLLAFGGSRTYHRLACAVEDAGFEIRDQLQWLYGSGFPKSKNLCDCLAKGRTPIPGSEDEHGWVVCLGGCDGWIGLGTALKPAHEPIVLARKPLIGTVVANVSEHGTGALHIDGCRIGNEPAFLSRRGGKSSGGLMNDTDDERITSGGAGRWPANVLLGHSPECRELGVKRVKGDKGSTRGGRSTTEHYRMHHDIGQEIGYADPDGYETVTAWECAPDCAVALLDAQSGERGGAPGSRRSREMTSRGYKGGSLGQRRAEDHEFVGETQGYTDTGTASRFFLNVAPDDAYAWYVCDDCGIVRHIDELTNGCPTCGETMVPYTLPIDGGETRFRYAPKASRAERNAGLDGMPERGVSIGDERPSGGMHERYGDDNGSGRSASSRNHHPTVKPIALMRWLVQLITPPGGTVLDPFLGSGTTGIAAHLEGFDFIGVEQDGEYIEIARRRIAHWQREADKASDYGPLFAQAAD